MVLFLWLRARNQVNVPPRFSFSEIFHLSKRIKRHVVLLQIENLRQASLFQPAADNFTTIRRGGKQNVMNYGLET